MINQINFTRGFRNKKVIEEVLSAIPVDIIAENGSLPNITVTGRRRSGVSYDIRVDYQGNWSLNPPFLSGIIKYEGDSVFLSASVKRNITTHYLFEVHR